MYLQGLDALEYPLYKYAPSPTGGIIIVMRLGGGRRYEQSVMNKAHYGVFLLVSN